MSLFDLEIDRKAQFFPDYLSFDDNFPFAVQILDRDGKEIKIEVFQTKELALKFENEFNKKTSAVC